MNYELKDVDAVGIVGEGGGLGTAEGLRAGDARVTADDALQKFGVGFQAVVDNFNIIVELVVYHPNGGRIILILNEQESSCIHVGNLVHQMDGLLVFQIVVELVMQCDGLAFLC